MTFKVRSLPRAQSDVENILYWMIHERKSPQGASAWLRAYHEAASNLAEHAESYALAPEAQTLGRDVRQLLFKTRHGRTYRAVYIIAADEVLILRVRGPGQPQLQVDEMS
jgi:plasmid stabilization system protein ParE